MKKTLSILFLSIMGIPVFVGNINGQVDYGSPAVDFVILEMKLGAILGGYQNGKFVNAKIASSGIKAGEDITLFGFDLSASEGVLKVTKKNKPDEICPDYFSIETNKKQTSGIALSSNARWNATPRIPQKISLKSRVYRRIVRNLLIKKGIRNPIVKINQAYRIDLDGDGQTEVVIRATKYRKFGASETKGDYSFVIVRKIIGKRVKNILLNGDFSTKAARFSAPNRHEISAIADLDGDGIMEVVVYGEYYEGSWVEAFKIKGAKAHKILQTGCGV